MKIDFVQTAERAKVLNYAEVARKLNLSSQLVWRVISGNYWSPRSEKAALVINYLRELGMLVEVPDDDDIDKAA